MDAGHHCKGEEGETEEYAGEVTGLGEHRIRIEPDASIVTRIRVGLAGGQPAGAEVETSHREEAREVEELEFERRG